MALKPFITVKITCMLKTIALLSCLLIGSALHAQTEWTWESYGVKITLPQDFKVTQNTDNEFSASGRGMEFYMFIFEQDISLEEMGDATLQAAAEAELDELDDIVDISTRSFKGKMVEGYKDGARAVFAGLINPNNHTNFFVLIMFDDNDVNAENKAVAILKSIKKA